MRIEAYFHHIQKAIESCRVLQVSNVIYDKRGTYEGFIHGELYFVDGSILHFREMVDVEMTIYPHHKHEGSEENIIASFAPDLAVVLSEVERLVRLP